jgi:hypothetical protein
MDSGKMTHGGKSVGNMAHDGRTSVGWPPMMAEHQLANMREYLKGVEMIIGSVADRNFDAASKTAREKLGSTPHARQMCENVKDDAFCPMALEFHKNGDALAEALKTKDVSKSLKALDDVLVVCTSCHDAFRR